MAKTIKPLGDRLLVKIFRETTKDVGGVKLQLAHGKKKEWEEEVLKAQVLSVGPDIQDIQAGEFIIIRGDAGRHVDNNVLDGADMKTHRIVEYPEVLGLWTDTEGIAEPADVLPQQLTVEV